MGYQCMVSPHGVSFLFLQGLVNRSTQRRSRPCVVLTHGLDAPCANGACGLPGWALWHSPCPPGR